MGEIIAAATAKGFAAKFFPGNSDPFDLDQTASMLSRATEEHDNVLRSAACGGVKVALAMLWAWYLEINMHMATEYMPVEDEHGNAINPKELMASVYGYATRLANLVNLGIFYKAHPDPHTKQVEASASANVEGDEELAAERSPKETEQTPQDAGTGDQDLDIPSDPAAAP